MACSRRDDDDVARPQVVRNTVSNFRAVVPRPVEFPDRLHGRRTALFVRDVGAEHERRRAGDDVVDLADEIVLRHRVRPRSVQRSSIDHTDADVSLADVVGPDLLIGQTLVDRLLGVGLDLRQRDVCALTHVARRLWVGLVDPRLLRRQRKRKRRHRRPNQEAPHEVLPGWSRFRTAAKDAWSPAAAPTGERPFARDTPGRSFECPRDTRSPQSDG